jgi:guanylate kinase
VVLSSPSGAGKTTIAERLVAAREDLGRSISATTRPPRPGEIDGRDYYFLAPDEFARREAAGEFVETATYGGYRYGTLKAEVERLRRQNRHTLLVIEVAGAREIRRQFPGAVLVFLLPPSGEALVTRLATRETEPAEALRRRLAIASDELSAVREYDYLVVNEDLTDAVREISAILDAEGRRVGRQEDLGALVGAIRRGILAEAEKLREQGRSGGSESASEGRKPKTTGARNEDLHAD